MRQHPSMPRRLLPAAALISALTLLAACAGPGPDTADSGLTTDSLPLPGELPTERPAYSEELPPSIHAEQFQRVEEALAAFDPLQAEFELSGIEEPLNLDDAVYRDYLLARIAWLRGDQAKAEHLLRAAPLQAAAPILAIRSLNFQRYMSRMAGDYLDSARLGSQLLAADPNQPSASALRRSVWHDLERLPARAVSPPAASADPQWQGWLELARISATASGADELRNTLPRWLGRHPDHPAARPLPGGLGELLEQPLEINRVALLLPLSGRLAPAARAVRDGYLAAYYADQASAPLWDSQREVMILDTDAYVSPAEAYHDAVARGAQMVVGPLSKNGVIELGQSLDRPVPIIALNRSEQDLATAATALVQLSLSPDDEIETLAHLAYGRGARRALVVRPAGAWGDRMDRSLRTYWDALGGSVATTAVYSSPEDYSDVIKRAFNLDASEQRARDLRSMLATNIEFSPRRRQDFDAIFLLSSSPSEARAVKPLLSFHYAGNTPVYAPSSVYSGRPSAQDEDLSGVRLVDLPWLVGDRPELRAAIAAGDTGSDSYTRLNALGADAFLVQSRVSQLRAGPDALLRGATGLLSLDPQLRILREPVPATFDRGELKPL